MKKLLLTLAMVALLANPAMAKDDDDDDGGNGNGGNGAVHHNVSNDSNATGGNGFGLGIGVGHGGNATGGNANAQGGRGGEGGEGGDANAFAFGGEGGKGGNAHNTNLIGVGVESDNKNWNTNVTVSDSESNSYSGASSGSYGYNKQGQDQGQVQGQGNYGLGSGNETSVLVEGDVIGGDEYYNVTINPVALANLPTAACQGDSSTFSLNGAAVVGGGGFGWGGSEVDPQCTLRRNIALVATLLAHEPKAGKLLMSAIRQLEGFQVDEDGEPVSNVQTSYSAPREEILFTRRNR